MINLILFCLGSVGFTHIIVDGKIFDPARAFLKRVLPPKVYELLECHQCSGMWCGMLLGAAIVSLNPFVIFACGCTSSFLSPLARVFVDYLVARSIVDIGGGEV